MNNKLKAFTIIFIAILVIYMLNENSKDKLIELTKENPFNYDLDIKIVKSQKRAEDVTICCHGYGSNSSFVESINNINAFSGSLIGFNFPDFNINETVDHNKSAYGTPQEILPLLYLLKRCVCDLKIRKVNLYGFSAGGGAIINTLVALTTTKYDLYLKPYEISSEDKIEILNALAKGSIILECPLKSVREIIALRGANKILTTLEEHYAKNNMEPIDALKDLKKIDLNIFLNFVEKDEVIGNKDDQMFIDLLKSVNIGKTIVSISSGNEHTGYHKELWENYKNFINKNK